MTQSNLNNYLFLINPAAGNWRGLKVINKIKNYLSNKKINHHIEISQFPGHISDIVRKFSSHFTHLISVGGDGTLNELINGINITSNNKSNTIGLLPIGTGNDFAKNLNLTKNITYNLDILFNSNKYYTVDIGQAIIYEKNLSIKKYHKFINSLGIGFEALVAKINQKTKHLTGLISYVYAVLFALAKRKDLEVEILINNSKVISGKKLLISIGNGYSTGGGFHLTPNAKIDDNQLDICIIDSVSPFKIINSLPKVLFNKLEKVKEAKILKFNNVSVKLKEPTLIHTDGEIISESSSFLEISLTNEKVKVIAN